MIFRVFVTVLIPSVLMTATERASRIKVLVFDVDGVLTDGTLWFIPTGKDANSQPVAVETKGFSAHDGLGIAIGRTAGLKVAIVTKRQSDTVAVRMRDLKIDYVYQGQHFKMRAVQEICSKEGITLDEVAYVGDDVIDLPVMNHVGLAIAVANARPQVKQMAHWTTPNLPGHGAGRDAIEFILEAQGKLAAAMATYLDEANEGKVADIGQGGM